MKNDKLSNAGISNLTVEDLVDKSIHQKEENDAGVCVISHLEDIEPPNQFNTEVE